MIGVGVALTAPSLMTALLSCVDRSRSGMASGVLNTFREAGSAVGVALFGAFVVENAVTGIHEAIILSALLLVVAAVIAITAVRPERAAVLPK